MLSNREWAFWFCAHGLYERASDLLQLHVLKKPEDWCAHKQLIRCFWREKTSIAWHSPWKQCDEFYDGFSSPNQVWVKRFVRAEQLVHDGNEPEAIPFYENMIGSGHEHPCILYCLAVALDKIDRTGDAINACRRALELDQFYLPAVARLIKESHINVNYDFRLTIAERIVDAGEHSFRHRFSDGVSMFHTVANTHSMVLQYKRALQKVEDTETSTLLAGGNELFALSLARPNHIGFAWATLAAWRRAGRLALVRNMYGDCFDDDNPVHKMVIAYCDHFGKQDFKAALNRYTEVASEATNGLSIILYLRALLNEDLKQTKQEQQDLDACLALQPNHLGARREVCKNELNLGNYDSVLKLSTLDAETRAHALAFQPRAKIALEGLAIFRAIALQNCGRTREAIEFLIDEESMIPGPCEDLIFRKALLHAALNQYETALYELKKAFDVKDGGFLSFSESEDLATLESISAAFPTDFLPLHAIALGHAYAGNMDEALNRMSELSEMRPNDAPSLYHRAQMTSIVFDDADIIPFLWRALECDSKHEEAYLLLVQTLASKGDIEALLRIVQLVPDRPQALEAILNIYISSEDKSRAFGIVERLLKEHPDSIFASFWLHNLAPERPENGEVLLKKIPYDIQVRAHIAAGYYEGDRFEESIRHDKVLLQHTGKVYFAWRAATAALLSHDKRERRKYAENNK